MIFKLRASAREASWRLPAAALVCVAALIAVEAALIAPGHLLAGAIVDASLLTLMITATANVGAGDGTGRADAAHPVPARAQRASLGTGVVIVDEGQRPPWRSPAGGEATPVPPAAERPLAPTSAPSAALRAIRALVLVALIRVVGLGLPLHDGSEALGTLVVAVLICFAAIRIAPLAGVSLSSLARVRCPRLQAGAAAAGLLLGFVAYGGGAPRLWHVGAGVDRVAVALIAALAAAAVEEVVFRGVVQVSLQRAAGRAGLIGASLLFAATYLDLSTAALVMVIALAGLVFAYTVARSETLTGAIAGHGLLLVSAGWLWPTLVGRQHPDWFRGSGATAVLGVALLAMTAVMLRGIVAAREEL